MSRSPGNRRQNNRRRHAVEKWADHILETKGFACHWCGTPLVRLAHLQKQFVVTKKTATFVTWLEDGLEKTSAFATLDHVVPLSDNGHNGPHNFVPSCMTCNKDRTRQIPPHGCSKRSKTRRRLNQKQLRIRDTGWNFRGEYRGEIDEREIGGRG